MKNHSAIFSIGQNIKCFTLSLLCVATFAISGCDLAENSLKSDREQSLEFQDYRDGLATRIPDAAEEDSKRSQSSIPALQPYVAQSSDHMKPMPLVSISVNQAVPLRDVLFELAQQADYDIELDPRIRGAVIYTAKNKPFDQVIDRISDMAGLRYKFNDDSLRVELDTAYNKVYKIDYLSYIRSSSSGIRNDIAVVSGDGADSGSNFEANAQSEINFWGELETNLEQIIRGTQTGALKTSRDPRISAVEQNPNVQAVAPDADGNVTVAPPQANLQVDSLPADEDLNAQAGVEDNGQGTFTLNKQAGLINVFATEKAHKEVSAYLQLLKKAVTSQVLIEAKVLEVALNDEFVTGIDWSLLDLFSSEVTLDFLTAQTARPVTGIVPSLAGAVSGSTVASNTSFVAGYEGNDVQALVQAVSGFGTVKALASPRMTVLNNQSAVLNVATNRVFFELDIDVTTEDGTTNTDIDSEIRNVPEGVLVNVQPSINLEDRTVSLALRPTITQVVDEIDDPAVLFVTASAVPPITGVTSRIPELNVQEIDSVIKVRSGQPVVMGGLLQDRIVSNESGVPILGEAPVLGALFKDHDDLIQKTELVIFLEATILDSPSDSIHNTDKDLYRQFSSDRRPLRF